MRLGGLALLTCTALVAQAPVPQIPPCLIAGVPNAQFEAELDEAIRVLSPGERRGFFKALRVK